MSVNHIIMSLGRLEKYEQPSLQINSLMRARVITYFGIHIHYMMCLVYKLYVHN